MAFAHSSNIIVHYKNLQINDIGHILENIVYLELLRRGYTVSIGKVEDKEIDFIAVSGGDKIYYQVAARFLILLHLIEK